MQPKTNSADHFRPTLPSGLMWLAVAALTGLYLTLSFYRISDVPLLDPDEPRYAAAGRTISRPNSSLLVPQFNGEKRINKPPLFYWLVAISGKVCGAPSEVSARLPSIVLGLFMLLGTVYVGCLVFGRSTALLGGLVLATTPLFMALSRTCITDMTLSAFMAAALGVLMLGMLGHWTPRRALWLGTLFLGLAVLTKAHTALSVVLALCVERALALRPDARPAITRFLPWMIAAALLFSGIAMSFDGRARKAASDTRHAAAQKAAAADSANEDDTEFSANATGARYHSLDNVFKYASMALIVGVVLIVLQMAWRAPRGTLSAIPWKTGLSIAFAMGLWWYAALVYFLGWNEVKALLDKEIGQRLAGSMHREPMYYYLYTFFAVAFPWSLGIAGALGGAWPVSADPESDPPERRADRFLMAWIIGIVLFFSIPNAKLATYILAAMPAFALLTARALQRLARADASFPRIAKQATAGVAILLALALLVLGLAYQQLPQSLLDVAAKSPVPILPLSIAMAVLISGSWLIALRGGARLGAGVLAFTTLGMIGFGLPAAMPAMTARSARDLCLIAKPKIADCDRVALVGSEVESLPYYLDRTIPECRKRDPDKNEPYDVVLREELSRPEKVALFVQKRYFARAIGVKSNDFDSMSAEQIAAAVPDYAQFVATNRDIVVIRNKR